MSKRPDLSERNRTHGMSKTPEYLIWASMIQRCTNKNKKDYPLYGGRGITVCDSWKNSFENFIEDIGRRPSKNHSLDRINNNDGYKKSNCRWTNIYVQSANKRMKKNNTSKIEGVNKDKNGNYVVRGSIFGKRKYLGYFDDFFEACCCIKKFNKIKHELLMENI